MPNPYAGNPSNATPQRYAAIQSATNSMPIVVGTEQPHLFSTGDRVKISGVSGCTAANSRSGQPWTITVTDAQHFSLNCSVGNGSYVYPGSGAYAYAVDCSFPSSSTNTGNDVILRYNVPVQDMADRTAWLQQQSPGMYLVDKYLATPTFGATPLSGSPYTVLVSSLLPAVGWHPGDILDATISGDVQYYPGSSPSLATGITLMLGWVDDTNGAGSFIPLGSGGQTFQQGAAAPGAYEQACTLRGAIKNNNMGAAATVVGYLLGEVQIGGLTGMQASVVGNALRLLGCGTAGNNGKYPITAFNSATEVTINNNGGSGADAMSGQIRWGVYNTGVQLALLCYGASGDSVAADSVLAAGNLQVIVDHYRSTTDPLLASLQ